MNYEIDNVDEAILTQLMADARTPYTEIAKKLLISAGTVHVRMKKMEENGIVQKATLQLNHAKMGFDLIAFLGIYLDKGSSYKHVIADLHNIDEIVEAHYATGVYGIFAKLVCKNTNHMRQVLNDDIQAIVGIQRTETIISLEESIRRAAPIKVLRKK